MGFLVPVVQIEEMGQGRDGLGPAGSATWVLKIGAVGIRSCTTCSFLLPFLGGLG